MEKNIEIYERKRAREATAPRAPKEHKDTKDPKKNEKKTPAAPAPAERKKRSSDGGDGLPRSDPRCSDADPKPNLSKLPEGMRACRYFMSAKGCRKENKCDMWHDKETKKQHDKKNGKAADPKAKAKSKAKGVVMKKTERVTGVVEDAAEEEEGGTNDADEAVKYQQALVLTDGDQQLSRAVMNINRTARNAWQEYIHGPAPQELKDEWNTISTCGFGNQKK